MGIGSGATAGTEGPALLAPGETVDHFRVVRLIGRGGMGEVYLARDGQLGRRVALKIIRPEMMAEAETRERFLREARITARFSHPNIVAIHGVGELRGTPYVALEHLEGQTLRERADEARLSTSEAARVGLAVAEALAEAHGHGVLHRDLKPENVLLARDGRPRVLDFGLAKPMSLDRASMTEVPLGGDGEVSAAFAAVPSLETSAEAILGTPAYMAPEQWMQQGGTEGAIDVWALGTILYELVEGRLPFGGKTVWALCGAIVREPPRPMTRAAGTGLASLIARCLAKAPEDRPSAAEAAEALRELLADRPDRPASESPFRGLLPFTERHADLFFGREAEVAAFVERLRTEPVLPVVGPSGAGKSSFVQAGVIPRLREAGRWLALTVRPGRLPFQGLSTVIRRGEDETAQPTLPSGRDREEADPGEAAAELGGGLLAAPGRLGMELRELAHEAGSRVLLFVDQLEELFTLTDDEEVRRRFMESVCGAADDPEGPVRVVLTVRDDFLGRAAETDAARQAFRSITVLRAPGPAALREVVTRPVARAGYGFDDPELPDQMVAAVRGQGAALPLLQFACARLWEARDERRRLLLRAEHEAMGGVEGALANHVESLLDGLSPAQVLVARRLLVRLVTAEGTRRVAERAEALDGLGEDAEAVLARLTEGRAVVVRKGRRGPELELVHESLITRWERLRRWVEEGHEETAFVAELGQAAELWDRRGRPADEAWRGRALAEALYRAERVSALPALPRAFLEAGRRREARGLARRRTALVAVIALLAGLATVFGLLAQRYHRERTRAEVAGRSAVAREAEALRHAALAALLAGSPLEARARLRSSLEAADSRLARALLDRLGREPLLLRVPVGGGCVGRLAFSPDGGALLAYHDEAYVIDTTTAATRVLRGLALSQCGALALAPDGRRLAASSGRRSIVVTELGDGLEAGTTRALEGHRASVTGLAWSPDGARLASVAIDGSARLWDGRTGESLRVLAGHEREAWSVAFSPDGARLATGGYDGLVRLYDGRSGEPSRALEAGGRVGSVAFDPAGARLAAGLEDGRVVVFAASTGEVLGRISGHGGLVRSLAWGERALATGSFDGTARLVEGSTLEPVRSFAIGSDVGAVALDPSGDRLGVSTFREVRLLDVRRGGGGADEGGHEGAVTGLAVSPDGRTLATGGLDGRIRLWDAATGRSLGLVGETGEDVESVAFSPDGRRLASGGFDDVVRVWDVERRTLLRVLAGHDDWVRVVRFSPDGALVASSSHDGTVRLWDPARGLELRVLRGHEGTVFGLAFSPDGARLASGGSDRTVRLWNVEPGEAVAVLEGHGGTVSGLAFTPDGATLVTSDSVGELRRWDVATGAGQLLDTLEARVLQLDVDRSGRLLGMAASDGAVRVRDLVTSATRVFRGHVDLVENVRFTPDGLALASVADDGGLRLWDPAGGPPPWRAPLLSSDPPLLRTHRGWLPLGPGASREALSEAFRRAVEERALTADLRGRTGCLASSERLERWDLGADRVAARARGGADRVLAVGEACVALDLGRLVRLSEGGEPEVLAEGVSAIDRAGDGLVAVTAAELRTFDSSGAPRGESVPVEADVTAVAALGAGWAFGFRDGTVEVQRALARTPLPERVTLEGTPRSRCERIVEASEGIVAAGFANGEAGLWDGRDGTRLARIRLAGRVSGLAVAADRLTVVTATGDHGSIDLGVYRRAYCDLLREVWQTIPVAWRGGRPARAEPDPTHPCSRR